VINRSPREYVGWNLVAAGFARRRSTGRHCGGLARVVGVPRRRVPSRLLLRLLPLRRPRGLDRRARQRNFALVHGHDRRPDDGGRPDSDWRSRRAARQAGHHHLHVVHRRLDGRLDHVHHQPRRTMDGLRLDLDHARARRRWNRDSIRSGAAIPRRC